MPAKQPLKEYKEIEIKILTGKNVVRIYHWAMYTIRKEIIWMEEVTSNGNFCL